MKRIPSIRIYALAVCFVSIICAAITSGFVLYNLIKLAAPEFTMEPWRLQNFSSNEVFVNSADAFAFRGPVPAVIGREGFARSLDQQNPFADMTEEEITEIRLARRQAEIDAHKATAILSLIRQGIIILVSSLLFFIHWRLARNIGTDTAHNPEDDT